MKFQLLITNKIPKKKMKINIALNTSYVVFILLINVKMTTIVGILAFMRRIIYHFNIYEHDKFHARLS